VEVELRKIGQDGVELEVKLKIEWRWSGVEVKTSGVVENTCGSGGRNFEF
jgi:hypothetical protein